MAEEATDGAPVCANCGTPIVYFDKVVEVAGQFYCCPNCELASRLPESTRRLRRGGGLVLTCNYCHTPIFVPEIMVTRGLASYCCLNCAEAASARSVEEMSPQPAGLA